MLTTIHLVLNKTQTGAPPVYIAAENNVSLELMRLLLDRGGDPNKPDSVRVEAHEPMIKQLTILTTMARFLSSIFTLIG